jgi:hypothetical protein
MEHGDWNIPKTLKRSSQVGKKTCEEILKKFVGAIGLRGNLRWGMFRSLRDRDIETVTDLIERFRGQG